MMHATRTQGTDPLSVPQVEHGVKRNKGRRGNTRGERSLGLPPPI